MIVTVHAPPRGFFTSRFALPIGTPEVLVGPRGEIARRIEQLGTAVSIYQMSAFAESLDHVQTYSDGTVATASYLNPAPVGVDPQFMLHPALMDDPTHFLKNIKIDNSWVSHQITPYSSSAVHRCWKVEARSVNVSVIVWLHFSTMSSIVEGEAIAQTFDKGVATPTIRLEFSEKVVPCFRGNCSVTDSTTPNILDIFAVVDTASLSRSTFRVLAKFIDSVDVTLGSDPVAELTGDEHEWAHLGPWYGMEIEEKFGGNFLGLPIASTPNATTQKVIADWSNISNQKRPLIPRSNPNAGGTDDSFGAVCSVPFNGNDPRVLRALLWSSEAWFGHPINYCEPGTNRPLSPPPAHTGLTTHKLQPWKGKIDSVTVPIGRSEFFEQDPFDPQHRAFLLPLTVRMLTGSPSLDYWIKIWMGSELFDRDTRVGFSGNGRQVGRILYNVVPAYRSNNDTRWLNYALEVARQSKLEVDKLTISTDKIRPCFVSDRGLPWVGWTPWEEAQRAIGLWQLYGVTNDPEHERAAYECAYTVASVLGFNEGVYWLPYRCHFVQNPDVSNPRSTDVYSPNYGPGGLFSWSCSALRLLCMMQVRRGTPADAVVQKAGQAVQWMDAHQHDHIVDSQMSLKNVWAAEVATVVGTN